MNKFDKEGLYFLPLGGADEIGINLYVYACNNKLIIVDSGYGFLNDYPGLDLSLADPSFLEEYADDVEAMFITHAHEDHFGAVGYVWQKVKCPIYATDFCLELIKQRLKEHGLKDEVSLNSVKDKQRINLKNFSVEYVSMVHSVPETCALIIRTKYANVVHATDWRFDDNEDILLHTNYTALENIAKEGVSMFVCDSTNVMNNNKEVSELVIRKSLESLIPQFENGLVATCFASNLYRLESLILAADKAGRTPVLVGRSLLYNMKSAKKCGYFTDLPKYYDDKQASDIPSEKALYICTGSQGNERSALMNILKGVNKNIKLKSGDSIIFSSKIIPGNEDKIEQMQEEFYNQGIDVITQNDALVHTSGHPGKEDLEKMYKLLKPQIVIPVHGDKRFIREHQKFALSQGIKTVGVVHNGDVMLIRGGQIQNVGQVQTDVLAVDYKVLTPINSELMQDRLDVATNGSIFISAVFDEAWQLKGLKLSSRDIWQKKEFEPLRDEIEKEVSKSVIEKLESLKYEEKKVLDFIRNEVKKHIKEATGRDPVTYIHFYKL